ncbi:MAG TPA: Lrp/AsnC ligand binding domain-containing protein [Sulfolobales archaeon]|nr:Lrp/AsnC ligand binding domain-containing protein [Sulfolobales archaeon]
MLFPVVAYVLIKTSIGKAGDVVQRIRGISGVKEAYTVTGEYDVIAN